MSRVILHGVIFPRSKYFNLRELFTRIGLASRLLGEKFCKLADLGYSMRNYVRE